jgi:hypothetical protein
VARLRDLAPHFWSFFGATYALVTFACVVGYVG